MTNSLFRAFGIAAGCVTWALATASTPPRHPALPITQPYAIDKAGHIATIDFWIEKGKVDTSRRLMLALDFPQTDKGTLEDAIQQQSLPIEAKVFFESGGHRIPVSTEDNAAILSAARGQAPKTDGTVSHLHLYATDGKTSNVLVTGFRVAHEGHYVAVVKTIQDQPLFKGINTVLRMDTFYNPGK